MTWQPSSRALDSHPVVTGAYRGRYRDAAGKPPGHRRRPRSIARCRRDHPAAAGDVRFAACPPSVRHLFTGFRHPVYRWLSRRAARGFPNMIIDCAHYQDGRRRDEGPVALQDAAARQAEGGFVWLGLFEPGEAELAEVRDTFGLHELAIEDALNLHVRPKIENYDQDVQLVILRTAR